MVHQHHEPDRNLADGPHGPAAARLPIEDPHPGRQGTAAVAFFLTFEALKEAELCMCKWLRS